jgi:hypothetical protein
LGLIGAYRSSSAKIVGFCDLYRASYDRGCQLPPKSQLWPLLIPRNSAEDLDMQMIGILAFLIAFFVLYKVVGLDPRRRFLVGVSGLVVLAVGFGICFVGDGDPVLVIGQIIAGAGTGAAVAGFRVPYTLPGTNIGPGADDTRVARGK